MNIMFIIKNDATMVRSEELPLFHAWLIENEVFKSGETGWVAWIGT